VKVWWELTPFFGQGWKQYKSNYITYGFKQMTT